MVGVNDGALDWFKYSQSLGDFCVANPSHAICDGSGGIHDMSMDYSGLLSCANAPNDPRCVCTTGTKVYNADTLRFECRTPPPDCQWGQSWSFEQQACVCPDGQFLEWTPNGVGPATGACAVRGSKPDCYCGEAQEVSEGFSWQGGNGWVCYPDVWCMIDGGTDFIAPHACVVGVSALGGVVCAVAVGSGAITAIPSGGISVAVSGVACTVATGYLAALLDVCPSISIFDIDD